MLRVLQLIPSMSAGGIESLVLELMRNLDRTRLQCDVAALNPVEPIHKKDFESVAGLARFISDAGLKGGLIPKLAWRFKAAVNFNRLLKAGRYDVLHCHLGPSHTLYTLLAWIHGVRVRIVHSHQSAPSSAGPVNSRGQGIRRVLRMDGLVTHKVGCGEIATKWLWGEGAPGGARPMTIYNGINLRRFARARRLREHTSVQVHAGPTLVHVGRFSKPKNQSFLFEVLRVVRTRAESAHLIIVGYGPLEDELRRRCTALGLTSYVTFLPQDADVPTLLSRSDVFVLPSLHEGLPIVAIEAQVAGLPVVLSNTVTREVDMGMAHFLPLSSGSEAWAETIVSLWLKHETPSLSEDLCARFDIARIASQWESIYRGSSSE